MFSSIKDADVFLETVEHPRSSEVRSGSIRATLESCNAVHIQGKDTEIISLNTEDSKLPESVSLRPHAQPSITTASIKANQIKQVNASAACSGSSFTPFDASTPSATRLSLTRRDNSGPLVEITYDINCNTLTVGQNAKWRRKLENFALKQGFSTYLSEMEHLTEIGQSVGGIFTLDRTGLAHLAGTCFMIGAGLIITNYHVMEQIEKMCLPKGERYVNFKFKKAGEEKSERRSIERLVMCSEELDYAILRMEKPHEQLPPSIFSHGISIMNPACPENNWSLLEDKPLRLIGHPQGQPKQIDVMCTINARPQSGIARWGYTVRKGTEFEGEAANDYQKSKDTRRRTYQSSNYFHGSSASPGVVLLSDRKLLVVLHARAFKDDKDNVFIEQGVLLTEIYKDVQKQIDEAQQGPLKDFSVEDLFPSVDCATQGCWGEPMEH